MGLYTMIGRGHKDARGQELDASMRSTMGRLRTWDLRTQLVLIETSELPLLNLTY